MFCRLEENAVTQTPGRNYQMILMQKPLKGVNNNNSSSSSSSTWTKRKPDKKNPLELLFIATKNKNIKTPLDMWFEDTWCHSESREKK